MYFHNKLNVPCSSGSFIITKKMKANEKFVWLPFYFIFLKSFTFTKLNTFTSLLHISAVPRSTVIFQTIRHNFFLEDTGTLWSGGASVWLSKLLTLGIRWGVDTAYHKTCLWRETNLNCALHQLYIISLWRVKTYSIKKIFRKCKTIQRNKDIYNIHKLVHKYTEYLCFETVIVIIHCVNCCVP